VRVVSLIVIAGIAGGVAAAGAIAAGMRWAMRRKPLVAVPPVPPPPVAAAAPEPSFDAFGFALGDVLMLRDTEAWLTGALRLTEAGVDEVCLFFTEGGGKGEALLVRPKPRQTLYLLRAVDLPDLGLAPHTIEHERELYARSRRVPVTIAKHGRGCPDVESEAMWSWFDSQGDAVVVVLQAGGCSLTWQGEPVDESGMMRLAAGKATLRDD
jgi:hypothetical protein